MGIEDMGFEEAFAQLEEIVKRLEEGKLPLAESLALFERACELASHCGKLLDQAELQVKALLPLLGGGYKVRPVERGPEGELLL